MVDIYRQTKMGKFKLPCVSLAMVIIINIVVAFVFWLLAYKVGENLGEDAKKNVKFGLGIAASIISVGLWGLWFTTWIYTNKNSACGPRLTFTKYDKNEPDGNKLPIRGYFL